MPLPRSDLLTPYSLAALDLPAPAVIAALDLPSPDVIAVISRFRTPQTKSRRHGVQQMMQSVFVMCLMHWASSTYSTKGYAHLLL